MKRHFLGIIVLCAAAVLSSCTVRTTTYGPAYTPAYYPGSPYWNTTNVYWRNSSNWYRGDTWRGYRGYYRYRWQY